LIGGKKMSIQTIKKLILISLGFCLISVTSVWSNDFVFNGKGWSASIGKNGLLTSFKIGDTEFMQPFPGKKTANIVTLQNRQEVPFKKVIQKKDGSVEASNDYLRLRYIAHNGRLTIEYRNLSKRGRATVIVMWRLSNKIKRAVDGEDDTSVNTLKTWWNDMVDARCIADNGNVLVFKMKGYWTRNPYTVKGVPCLAKTIYPWKKGKIEIFPEIKLSPVTALVFEVKGENPDFLPPGGRPAKFPCIAENLSKKHPLNIRYIWRILKYTDHSSIAEVQGNFNLKNGEKKIVPLMCGIGKPGVYRSELDLFAKNKKIKTKIWNFCYDFAEWQPFCPEPTDFDDFWEKTLVKLRKIPVDLKKQKISEDAKSVLYKVNYAVLNGKRGYAWLRIPKSKDKKKFSARLTCPPSGVNKIRPPRPSNAVEMSIAIHGYDVDLSNWPVKPPYPWPNARYHNVGLKSKETYFYRNVFCRCVRAVDI
ncbi:MAG: hypothetical protein D6707_11390, partial [Bacteroidetes bacterium]